MNAWPRIERDLPSRLTDLAAESRPDYLDDAFFGQMADIRQRPSWVFPERWLPVDISTRAVPAPRLPWRQLGVLALIGILLAATLAIYIGSQQRRLPAPFGPAANGHVAYAADGDIFVGDPGTGDAKAIIAGPEFDAGPRWSRDGTHFVFKREFHGDKAMTVQLYVAQADGSDLTLVTPEPVALTPSILGEPWSPYDFSPDGRSVLIATTVDGTPTIAIAASDGSGIRYLDVGVSAYEPSFRPPDGSEILFVGRSVLGNHDIMAVDPATGALRTIVEAARTYDLAGATWSPDGTSISYWMWGGPAADTDLNPRNHIIAADGTRDRILPEPPDAVWNALAAWSNDGTRLVIDRGYSGSTDDVRLVVIPVDGSSTGIELRYDGLMGSECCPKWQWAPDDSYILVTPTDAFGAAVQQVVIDPTTGRASEAPWASTSDPSVQRLAQP